MFDSTGSIWPVEPLKAAILEKYKDEDTVRDLVAADWITRGAFFACKVDESLAHSQACALKGMVPCMKTCARSPLLDLGHEVKYINKYIYIQYLKYKY